MIAPNRRCALKSWLIVDGHNLLFRALEGGATDRRALEEARRQLVLKLDRFAGILATRITVVFDGASGPRRAAEETTVVEVLFSFGGQTADAVIERLVSRAKNPRDILVVTSDRQERESVTAAGAEAMSAGCFLDRLKSADGLLSGRIGRMEGRSSAATLGDFFPED
ncbi:MAG: NYN domain-containing protein [Lentisphaerae bacterium]|nr:NYN domain-containing protein [Lentisphaerota bacterium]